MKIILASSSPRRKELLQALGFSFETISINCDESFPETMPSHLVASHIAQQKAKTYQPKQDEILLTADTVVVSDGKILGKPKNREQAVQMLQSISAKTHEVHSAFCLKSNAKQICISDMALVSLQEMSTEEIENYVDNYQPMDKAGSYGIQEWVGMAKCQKIEGSYYTIMGLPTHLVYAELQKFLLEK